MNNRYEISLTGSGGQGVILISVILAEAAVLDNDQTVQSQIYGPEARGGLCQADTIISHEKIWFSKPGKPDVLLSLTQAALDKYSQNVADSAVIIADSSLTLPEEVHAHRVIQLPILETAREKVGKALTANIVAVGAINSILELFPEDILIEAVKLHIPDGTEEINMKALQEGLKLRPTYDYTRQL